MNHMTASSNPKVSVIVPAYNVEKYIVQCVRSVQNQSYNNVELIVVDNESKDDTLKILEKMNSKQPFKLTTAKNIYPYCWDEGKDLGMSMMTGEWFTVIGADDYLDRDYIQTAVSYMEELRPLRAFQSPMKGMRNGVEVGLHQHGYSSLAQFKQQALERSPVNTPTVFYHRSLYEEGLMFGKPVEYSGAADYNLYCELADNGVFIHPIPVWIGYYYRWHDEQATWAMHKQPTQYDKMIQARWRSKWQQKT